MNDFIKQSQLRGFWNQCSNDQALENLMDKGPIVAYIGFDATAKSLQVGNLMAIMWLRLLQRCGHKPIVLLGGATTLIGDPSGKDESRKAIDPEEVEDNLNRIQQTFERFLTIGNGPTDAIILNNATWLQDVYYIDFLRHIGRHFTINRMLSFDSVQSRLNRQQPLSFLEFNYMLLQAYDFYILRKDYGCVLQMGGSDQWGNIVNGIDLTRRLLEQEVIGLTCPLITKSDGTKMGKTAAGAIWLSNDFLDSYDYWQFWRNTADDDVIRFLKIFTDLPLETIDKLANLSGADLNEAKKILADEATVLAHGKQALIPIHEKIAYAFGGIEKENINVEAVAIKLQGPWPYPLDQLLVDAAFCETKGQGRRLVQGRGVKINDVVVLDEKMLIDVPEDSKKPHKISVGKKRHCWIKG